MGSRGVILSYARLEVGRASSLSRQQEAAADGKKSEDSS
jgi:hypothetical protein